MPEVIQKPDTLTQLADTVSRDSLSAPTTHPAIIFSSTEEPLHKAEPAAKQHTDAGSWLLLTFLIMLVALGLKFRNSTQYLSILIRELLTTRRRHNMFDDTVRETSFLLLLNLVTLLSGGLLLYGSISGASMQLAAAAVCMGVTVAYGLFMWLAYRITAVTFIDDSLQSVWLRGHSAAQGLLSIILLPLALVAIAEPTLTDKLAIAALAAFVIAKLLFIYKGFRIFIHGINSFIVFFYYLCSLEIVPLLVAYRAAEIWCASVS